jgi:hypothetical protein
MCLGLNRNFGMLVRALDASSSCAPSRRHEANAREIGVVIDRRPTETTNVGRCLYASCQFFSEWYSGVVTSV